MSINPRVRLFSFFSIDTHQLFFICGLFLIHLGCDALRFEPRIDGNNEIIDDDDLYVESIEITYPNGGESFDPGTIVTITWENTIEPCEWGVNIVLIDDDEIAFNIATNIPNDGSFDWYVDTDLDHGDDYKIRLDGLCFKSDYCNGCINDQMSFPFSISQDIIESFITVLSPNGGENFEFLDESISVAWESNLPDCIWGMKISLYKDSVEERVLVYDTPNDGLQELTIQNENWGLESGDDYTIYVESLCKNGSTFCGGCFGDFSDESFRLYYNELILTEPNGGEDWTRGETETISWTDDSTTQNVRLELWKAGEKLQDIYYLLENEFSFDWAPLYALTPDDDYKIKVISWETNKSDLSDTTFSIQ